MGVMVQWDRLAGESPLCPFITCHVICCSNSNSIAEGDSDDDDDEGDLILENDCLTPYESHRVTGSNDTNLDRDSPNVRLHSSAAVRPLPQSVSLPNSMAASLSDRSLRTSNHNGNPAHTASGSPGSMREDGNIITL